jgi:hypothetical protein
MSAPALQHLQTPSAAGDFDSGGVAQHLRFVWDVRSSGDLLESMFARRVTGGGLAHFRWEQHALVDSDPDDALLELSRETVATRRTEAGLWCLLDLDEGAVGLVAFRRGSVSVELAGHDQQALEKASAGLAVRLGAAPDDSGTVPIAFWALGSHGARSARRNISAGSWGEVAANYERSTAAALTELMNAHGPEAGRLILWHGEPGTGKTNALRVLAHLWKGWCATHFVSDPEAFLGAGTSYLLDVLTSENKTISQAAPAWKLVVLEDSGELLTADAHERTGQALSRLLNVTDGLLGQGMRVVALVTTNEPLQRLHPAIQREGRCWTQIEFRPLSVEEANRWLADRDSSIRVVAPTPLADLYAALRGSAPKAKPSIGFGAG